MIPLRPQVHPQTMSQIFGNIEDLLNCNRRFLADLDRIRPNTYKDFNVGKTLSLYSHFFRVYKQYCNNYGDAMVVLGKLCSKDSQFEKFLNRAEQTSNHKLVDILITPIQRLVRLKLLLERIIKFTDESHEDFADLKCALVGISEVADYVNKGISQKEARLRVWEVQRMLVRIELSTHHKNHIFVNSNIHYRYPCQQISSKHIDTTSWRDTSRKYAEEQTRYDTFSCSMMFLCTERDRVRLHEWCTSSIE